MVEAYEVALWPRFKGGEIPCVWDRVEVISLFEMASSLEMVLRVMKEGGMRRVEHAAVRSVVGGSIERWTRGRQFWVNT